MALAVLTMLGPIVGAVGLDRSRRGRLISPEELRVRARDLVNRFEGQSAPSRYEASGVYVDYGSALPARARGSVASAALHGPHRFWYRTSPVPFGALRVTPRPQIDAEDPGLTHPGMTLVVFDLSGRLIRYVSVHPDREAPGAAAFAWNPLLEMAGINGAQLNEGGLGTNSISANYRDRIGLVYHVDGLAPGARLRHFRVRGEWELANDVPSQWPWRIETVVLGLALYFAIQNIRRARVDAEGTRTVVLVMLAANLAGRLLRGTDLLHWNYSVTLIDGLTPSVTLAAWMGCAYLAMEPFVRRYWPSLLVTWTRLVRGGWRDATVGRDVLIGMATLSAMNGLSTLIVGHSETAVNLPGFKSMQSTPFFLGGLFAAVATALNRAVLSTFVIFVLRVLLRNDLAAGAGLVVLFAAGAAAATGAREPHFIAIFVLIPVVITWLLMRFGFLARFAGELVVVGSQAMIQTLDPSQWFVTYSYVALALLAVLVFLAYRVATQGQQLWAAEEQP